MTPQQRITIATAAVTALSAMTATRSITPAYLAAVFTKVIDICTDEDSTRSTADTTLTAAVQTAVASITTEETARAAADTALQGRATALETRCTTLEGILTTAEVDELMTADEDE